MQLMKNRHNHKINTFLNISKPKLQLFKYKAQKSNLHQNLGTKSIFQPINFFLDKSTFFFPNPSSLISQKIFLIPQYLHLTHIIVFPVTKHGIATNQLSNYVIQTAFTVIYNPNVNQRQYKQKLSKKKN